MQSNDFFRWIGEQIGAAIRLIVDSLARLFTHIHAAIDSFTQGLTGALGISASVFSVALLVIGLAMLVVALKSLFNRRWVAALLWTLLGIVLLSWLIQ